MAQDLRSMSTYYNTAQPTMLWNRQSGQKVQSTTTSYETAAAGWRWQRTSSWQPNNLFDAKRECRGRKRSCLSCVTQSCHGYSHRYEDFVECFRRQRCACGAVLFVRINYCYSTRQESPQRGCKSHDFVIKWANVRMFRDWMDLQGAVNPLLILLYSENS